jgi:hypothetical protein
LGRTGFVNGDQVLEKILARTALIEVKKVEMGDQQEAYYYSRE